MQAPPMSLGGSVMVAPQPIQGMNQAALTKLKLNPTAQGIKVFNIKFAAACGPMLTMSLKHDKTITSMPAARGAS